MREDDFGVLQVEREDEFCVVTSGEWRLYKHKKKIQKRHRHKHNW